MSTKYVFDEIEIEEDVTLYVDGNSKITVGNGTYENPIPNAFSLPHISTCPGATKECMSSCYVFGLQKHASEVYSKYCQNERIVNKILSSNSLITKSADLFGKWISENCPDGFRWHVSGDVFSTDYAEWILRVCDNSVNVRHWIYTRSLFVLPILIADNLVVNVSCDSENYKKASELSKFEGNRLCYLTRDGAIPDDLPDGSVIFPDYKLRGRDLDKPTEHDWWKSLDQKYRRMVCPADFFGQSERHRCGPCDKCLK